MRYFALATDYDGTLATHGRVLPPTIEALQRLRASGRKLLMVTGRELDDLGRVFDRLDLFDMVVAENGALLYTPATKQEKVLGERPPERFGEMLAAHGVGPISFGRVIVATWEPHEKTVLEVIHELGLELQVIFNKGAVMILPSGVNKATGLRVALDDMGLSLHNTVGIGDAENDHAFLSACECGVAVANALPSLKERADFVTKGDHGSGVEEIVDMLVESDLSDLAPLLENRGVLIGTAEDGGEVRLPPYGSSVMLAGTSGSGKSTIATGIMERLCERGYQFCVIDPEGDYSTLEFAVALGDPHRAPSPQEVLELLAKPRDNVVANLVGVALAHRPALFETLLPQIQALRVKTGRPHWLVIDEAHHLLPTAWDPTKADLPQQSGGMLYITVHPESVSLPVLESVDTIIAVGQSPEQTIAEFCAAVGEHPPATATRELKPGEAVVWRRRKDVPPMVVVTKPPKSERRRHVRKYTEGDLGERSFYFRGPEGKLNLKAQNLITFLQLAEGVDDETWLHHLHQGDYSAWFRDKIKDPVLADEAHRVETMEEATAQETRQRIKELVEKHYTLPD